MKIVSNRNNKKSPLQSSLKSAQSSSPSSFSKIIEENADEPILESLFSDPDYMLNNISILAEEMDKLGQELAERPLPEVFHKYQKYMRLILKGVSRNIEIRETTARVRDPEGFSLKTKLFYTAQNIDEILADLAHRILTDEKNRLDILNLTNQLKGLILDIIA